MTKAERIQLIRNYFQEVGRIDGAIPCIQWKHLWEPDMYLYSREDGSLALHEIIIVKSPSGKVDNVLKYSIKHYFQTAEELDIILRTLSDKQLSSENAYTPAREEAFVGNTFNDIHPGNTDMSTAPDRAAADFHRSFSAHPDFLAETTEKKSRSHAPKIAAILLFLVLLVAFYTNPSEEKHRTAVQDKVFSEAVGVEGIAEASLPVRGEEVAGTAPGQSLERAKMEQTIPSMVHRKNYYVFSLTELRPPENRKIIGAGLFGRVWLFGLEEHLYSKQLEKQESPITELEDDTTLPYRQANELAEAVVSADTPDHEPTQAAVSERRVDETVFPDKQVSTPGWETSQKEEKRPVVVAVMEKFYDPLSSDEQLTYKLVIQNKSGRDLQSVNGIVRFKDHSDQEINTLPLTYERPLGVGEKAVFHVTSDYDPSDEKDRLLRRKMLDELIVEWEPTEVLFHDGSTLSLN